jgi:hypothetical protein
MKTPTKHYCQVKLSIKAMAVARFYGKGAIE